MRCLRSEKTEKAAGGRALAGRVGRVGGLIGLIGLLAAVAASPLAAVDITGAGATFPNPIYAKWAEAYNQKTGVRINYNSIGSGGGIQQIKAKTVDFGASDMPLKSEDLEASGLLQFPMIMGGVVAVVNVKGIGTGHLKLDGPTLAAIFLGKITKWNDPALVGLNAGVKLPDQAITVVHRSDGSGTSFIFTHYLSEVSPEWKEKVGENASVSWPAGVGGKGNEGVAAQSTTIPGSIGYVEYAYALQNKLPYVLLKNRDGHFVKPSAASFQSAAANADWAKAPGFYLLLTNQAGAESWPITGASFILVYKEQEKGDKVREALKFFDWAYHNGQQMAAKLDYVPIPDKVVKLVEQTWASTIKAGGKPVWTSAQKGGKAGPEKAGKAGSSKTGGSKTRPGRAR
ncbi:MAG TPA: phosphate ABC transporter substrate-binding protein PstS [Thermoanaerobaculia bacterium]|nr:phosphate ABC transporter substrate-binding protein PstS [Thermoanaerobaculia bacterium]